MSEADLCSTLRLPWVGQEATKPGKHGLWATQLLELLSLVQERNGIFTPKRLHKIVYISQMIESS